MSGQNPVSCWSAAVSTKSRSSPQASRDDRLSTPRRCRKVPAAVRGSARPHPVGDLGAVGAAGARMVEVVDDGVRSNAGPCRPPPAACWRRGEGRRGSRSDSCWSPGRIHGRDGSSAAEPTPALTSTNCGREGRQALQNCRTAVNSDGPSRTESPLGRLRQQSFDGAERFFRQHASVLRLHYFGPVVDTRGIFTQGRQESASQREFDERPRRTATAAFADVQKKGSRRG